MSTDAADRQYGDAVSEFYDLLYPPADVPDMVEFMTALVPPAARVLDQGVGTGRTALPMAYAGYDVTGIDISPAMLDVLREKDIEERVALGRADFTDVTGDASFDLVVNLNNTLPMVLDTERRKNTFANAAANLRSGGHYVLDTASPFPYLSGETTRYQHVPLGQGDKVLLDLVTIDALALRVTYVRTILLAGGIMTMREENYLTLPTEMDAMAADAGLEPVARYENWQKSPASAQSVNLVSVYRKQ